MPLWIKPDHKVELSELKDAMRDHLEGTELDMSKDMGAGPFGNPYRWRPLTWEVDGVTVARWCSDGRVPGAIKTRSQWLIPSNLSVNDVNRPKMGRPTKEQEKTR
mgnify:CR=1 FL=1